MRQRRRTITSGILLVGTMGLLMVAWLWPELAQHQRIPAEPASEASTAANGPDTSVRIAAEVSPPVRSAEPTHHPAAETAPSVRPLVLLVRQNNVPVAGVTGYYTTELVDGNVCGPRFAFTADNLGAFSTAVPAGDLIVTVESLAPHGQRVRSRVPVAAAATEVEINISAPVWLRGMVVNQRSRLPIAGASVGHADGAEGAVTDAAGGFVIAASPDQSLTLIVAKSGYGTEFVQAVSTLAASTCEREVTVELAPEVTLRGRVQGGEGRARTVIWNPIGRLGIQPAGGRRHPVAEDGRFVVPAVAPAMSGGLTVEIDDDPWARFRVRVETGEVDVGTLELGRAGVLVLTREPASGCAGGVIYVRFASLPPSSSLARPDTVLRTIVWPTDEAGVQLSLPQGSARILGFLGRAAVQSIDIVVGERSVATLSVAPPPVLRSVQIPGCTHGTLVCRDADGKSLGAYAVIGAVARVPSETWQRVGSARVTDAPGPNWSREVEFGDGSVRQGRLTMPEGSWTLSGVVAAIERMPGYVRLEGKQAATTVRYRNVGIRPGVEWTLRVPREFEWSAAWGSVPEPQTRSFPATRALGAIEGDRRIIL